MNKKHLWGVLIVLAISAFVLYTDLKSTPLSEILGTAHGLNIWALIMVFGLMLLSYVCEAGILATLAHRKDEPKGRPGRFYVFLLFKLCLMRLRRCRQGTAFATSSYDPNGYGSRTLNFYLANEIYHLSDSCLFCLCFHNHFGFHTVMTKFAGLAVFIAIGFLIHISSIIFLLAIMFAYRFTKRATNWVMDLLGKFMKKERVENWRKATLEKIDTFYAESQKLKKEK